ncbi:MAG: ParB/RepB/Spo0J family partition protein [Chloroflexota bacterium]|nr:ParB/RepB/Spo0J family partition protein [Chloroflexota bacterium]MDE2896720.1 ParB/RepB/Spo0J family partition protein [Chloroflexota bacterium]
MTFSRKVVGGDPSDAIENAPSERRSILLDRIEPNPQQPRRRFDPAEEAALAESIRRHGVLQPLLVTPTTTRPGHFVLVAGERRWRAARTAGLTEAPVTVIAADAQRRSELALVENMQRRDLGPMERAGAYQALIDDFGKTQAQVADIAGVGRSTVANTLRLQKLDAEMQQALSEGRITESHGRTLVGISDAATRRRLFLQMLTGRLSLRQAERAARRTVAPSQAPDVELEHVAERLQWRLGTRVRFVGGRKRGRIQIEYRDPEDLDTLLSMLLPE